MPTLEDEIVCDAFILDIEKASVDSWVCQSRSEFGFNGIEITENLNDSYSFTYSAMLFPQYRQAISFFPLLSNPLKSQLVFLELDDPANYELELIISKTAFIFIKIQSKVSNLFQKGLIVVLT